MPPKRTVSRGTIVYYIQNILLSKHVENTRFVSGAALVLRAREDVAHCSEFRRSREKYSPAGLPSGRTNFTSGSEGLGKAASRGHTRADSRSQV